MSRLERILLGALAAFALVLRGIVFFHYRFDSDEPQHLHVAWGWSAGLVQYRDYFDNHAPLFHILTAPLLRLIGERAGVLLYMRAAMLPLFALVIFATYLLAKKMYSQRTALWSAMLLALFTPFFLKSVEYRTDNLWTALWAAALIVIVSGPMRVGRSFLTGLLLGMALAVSLKTVLLVITLLLAGAITWLMGRLSSRDPVSSAGHPDRQVPRSSTPARSGGVVTPAAFAARTLAAVAGFSIVPAFLIAYFRSAGAWDRLVYCVVTFNGLIMRTRDASAGHLGYPFLLAAVLYSAWIHRARVQDEPTRWRYFFALSLALFLITLIGFWVLISPRDMLPVMPLAMIFLASALLRLRRAVPMLVLTLTAFSAASWRDADGFRNHTAEHITMMNQVLGLTRPGELLMDLKGETIYRRRPFYYIFEFITRAEMQHGMIADTIPEQMVASKCHVAQADRDFFPERGRAFLNANFIDLGRLRASGQWLAEDGSFTIAIPGDYLILTESGPARGLLDGSAAPGPRSLAAGRHRFLGSGEGRVRLACLWAPAYARGYSPFHLRDRDF